MFDLHITCTKDITFLKINFADGTSVVGESKKSKKDLQSNKNNVMMKNEDYVDVQETPHKFKKVELPEIEEKVRTVKVAEELQDLEL